MRFIQAVVLANLDETKTVSIKLAASMLPRGDANVNAFEQAKWTVRTSSGRDAAIGLAAGRQIWEIYLLSGRF